MPQILGTATMLFKATIYDSYYATSVQTVKCIRFMFVPPQSPACSRLPNKVQFDYFLVLTVNWWEQVANLIEIQL